MSAFHRAYEIRRFWHWEAVARGAQGNGLRIFQLCTEAYLTDLNGGLEVQDREVDWVMKDTLNGV